MNFTWLADIFNGLLSFIPRPVIVRATHGGVRWRLGKYIKELHPGWHWYWPLFTDIEIIVVARQTHKVAKPQAIESFDGVSLAIGTLIVYSINDVVKAIGQRNWDVDSTINDITESAVVHTFNKWSYAEAREKLCGEIEEDLTEQCKKELAKFGVLVQQARITDFCKTEVKMLFGLTNGIESEVTE